MNNQQLLKEANKRICKMNDSRKNEWIPAVIAGVLGCVLVLGLAYLKNKGVL